MFTKGMLNNEYPFLPTSQQYKLIGCNSHLYVPDALQVLKIYLYLLRTGFSLLCVFLQIEWLTEVDFETGSNNDSNLNGR